MFETKITCADDNASFEFWARLRACGTGSLGLGRRVQASRAADAALAPMPHSISRVQAANIFRLLLVVGLFPFLFSVCRGLQTIARNVTSNEKSTPKPTHAARVELAPTGPTRLNPPPFMILSWRLRPGSLLLLGDLVPGVVLFIVPLELVQRVIRC